MPNHFCLFRKSDTSEKKEAVRLTTVDEELCAYLGKEVHPEYWCGGWYDTIGFALACGKTFDDMRTCIRDNEPDDEQAAFALKMINWFDDNFTSDAWATIGK